MATKLNRWHLFYTVLILLNNFAFVSGPSICPLDFVPAFRNSCFL